MTFHDADADLKALDKCIRGEMDPGHERLYRDAVNREFPLSVLAALRDSNRHASSIKQLLWLILAVLLVLVWKLH